MYNYNKANKTTLNINKCYEGESIEAKVRRVTTNKEPIKDGARAIYTLRKDGVQPAYNIRSDRWDIAADAMDTQSKARIAQREGRIGEMAKDGMDKEAKSEQKSEGQSTPGTETVSN